MPLSFRPLGRLIVLLAASLLAVSAQAQLQALEDHELSNITGQAFINLSTESANGINYSRINFGMDVNTQLNINKLELGNYARTGETVPADLSINNFALGTVNADDSINPFLIRNPYLELAYKDSKVVGVRIGFGEAQGFLSGDINSFTGNLAIDIYGTGQYLAQQIKAQNGCGTIDLRINCTLAGALNLLSSDATFKAQAELVCGPAMSNCNAGNPDALRALYAGLKDGTVLTIPENNGLGSVLVSALLPLITSQDCSIVGLTSCFKLSDYKTLPVGKFDTTTQQFTDTAKGVFIAMQTENLNWRDPQNANNFITALAGAFMNMPRNADGSGAVTLDFVQALQGAARQDTCLGAATHGC
ncbi:hypothetical protein NVV93_15670 [Pseudomonas sp. LS44]|uniref:DUF6160 family protein n=1 Tax=Pseudomonas sp. LS44 TaxID=1357074 RepID=UPI00215A9BD2|nr:DUF6160 family protein [Pseudomonas sp. LS44]UVE17015.1 hypothetical protein NVV93_15670 [Pseudomonas sp. LS44]